MKCTKCEHEMEGGYSFRLHFAGTIRIEKMEIKENSMQPAVGPVKIYAQICLQAPAE